METDSSSLPEKDYLQIIEIINGLHTCETKDDLEKFAKDIISETFNVQHVSFLWLDFDLKGKGHRPPKFFIHSECTPKEIEVAQKIIPYVKSIAQLTASSLRPVVAHDLDVPQATLEKEFAEFFAHHPKYDRNELGNSFVNRRFITAHDPPDFNLGIGLARYHPNNEPFTYRNVRMVELLRPSLFHTMKYIAINEELKNFRSLAETLADSPTAMAMVNPQGLVVYANKTFGKILNVGQGDFLPADLIEMLKEKDDIYSPGEHLDISQEDLTFYEIDQHMYRLTWTRLKRPGELEDRCWLLKVKPAEDGYSRSNLIMRQKNLTRREIEIATLVCDGFMDDEIAARLFISEHTVKNHMKQIFKKCGVNKRVQLVTFLLSGPNI